MPTSKASPLLVAAVVLWLGTAIFAAAAKPDVHDIAQKVDARYNHLHTLRADFTEIYAGAGMNRTESGTLWLKKPGKMRWEYRSPREKLFVSDGKDAWFYITGDRLAKRMPVKKLDDLRSPLGFLLGKTRLERELQGLSLAPDIAVLVSGDVVMRGVPKSMADRVSEVLLEITPDYRIARLVIEEVDGSSTEFRFGSQQEDVALADAQFHFSAPAGVEVVSAGELGP
jgi:outer membrane lipoprotein carrier protein